MEFLIAGAVVGALAVVVMPVFVLLGLAVAVWESWWLYPAWGLLLVPLGVPAVSFWHFAALNVFVSALWMSIPPNDYAQEADDTKRRIAPLVRTAALIVRPVVAWLFIRWALLGRL